MPNLDEIIESRNKEIERVEKAIAKLEQKLRENNMDFFAISTKKLLELASKNVEEPTISRKFHLIPISIIEREYDTAEVESKALALKALDYIIDMETYNKLKLILDSEIFNNLYCAYTEERIDSKLQYYYIVSIPELIESYKEANIEVTSILDGEVLNSSITLSATLPTIDQENKKTLKLH